MKNEKGQVLVVFILILPLIILGIAFIVDSSYLLYQKNRLDNINNDILNSIKDKVDLNEEEIKGLIKKNDAEIVNDDISIDNTITIENHIDIDSIFGKVIGFDKYRVTSKKSIDYKPLDKQMLTLNITNLNDFDDTNNYSIINNNVLYEDGLVFNNSSLIVNDFILPNNFNLDISFNYSYDGILLQFNNLIISIRNNNLYVNDDFVSVLKPNESYDLKIINNVIMLDDNVLLRDYYIDNYRSNLVIGNFSGKINYIKVYSIG